jgi:hypothetical protein
VTRRCECCGQPLPEVRLGARLSPLKASIFDAVKAAGAAGIEPDSLFERFIAPRGATRLALKAHVSQINDALAATDYQISAGSGGNRAYRLIVSHERKS